MSEHISADTLEFGEFTLPPHEPKPYPPTLQQVLAQNPKLPEPMQQELSDIFQESKTNIKNLSNEVKNTILSILQEGILVETEAGYNDLVRLVHALQPDAKVPDFSEVQEAEKGLGKGGWDVRYSPDAQKMDFMVDFSGHITQSFLVVDTATGTLTLGDKDAINAEIDGYFEQRSAIKIG